METKVCSCLKDKYVNLVKSELAPALGCTEPVAVALCAAGAAAHIDGIPEQTTIYVSQYIMKNGMNVGVPNTDMVGLDIATAMGVISARPEKGLLVLEGMTSEDFSKAKELLEQKKIHVKLAENDYKVYIEAICTKGSDTAKAIIRDIHNQFVYIEKNGQVLLNIIPQCDIAASRSAKVEDDCSLTVRQIYHEVVNNMTLEDLTFLREAVDVNKSIALEGLTHDYGHMVGKSILSNVEAGIIADDIANYAVALTAAAADARMAGCRKPVMSAVGSGNQGITATVPIIAVAERLKVDEEKKLKALAMSLLVTIHTKHSLGRLSVLCGCGIAAAIGSCAGIIYLFGGTEENIELGIQTMVADISGMVCDGAKPGCAIKIATAVSATMRSALLAIHGVGADQHDGIVALSVEDTLHNLASLGNEGMSGTNEAILDMMIHKEEKE
ncbi:MAG TPA: L-serine ammonia-lyase, iron-sulfur-dependent, subunit alpha [Firmicutes bacterium]|nr:L-serine ammonia-lyase, iron-sulfur-dependent, subunit alpha [Bacillota bacterium]